MTRLEKLAYAGLKKRGFGDQETYRTRLAYELDTVKKFELESYFLNIWDVAVRFASKEEKMLHSVRGSAAGSLLLYCLGVNHLDPIAEDLPFERFLNPGRMQPGMLPDIDLDFPVSGRQKIVEYLIGKYGKDKVVGIGTVGEYKARAAIKAAARALDYPYTTGERLSNLLPPPVHGFPLDLQESYDRVPELKQIRAKGTPEEREILELAEQLEGHIQNVSTHPAGIIICPVPVEEICPLQLGKDDIPVTQWSMEEVESLGLVKYDFLVIDNLDIVEATLKLIKQRHKIDLDIYNLPDSPKAWELLNKKLMSGIFQLGGSRGMSSLAARVGLASRGEISDIIALFRPGPLDAGLAEVYFKSKKGIEEPQQIHPSLKKVLEKTNGVLIYQEQVMKIASELAGFTLSEADVVRRALGHKDKELMAEQKEKLIQGLLTASHFTQRQAEQLWEEIVLYSGYSFNRCLPANQRVLTKQYGYIIPKAIEELIQDGAAGREVLLLSSNMSENPLLGTVPVGEREVIEVTLENGSTFTTTRDHRFMISTGEMKELEEIHSKKLQLKRV